MFIAESPCELKRDTRNLQGFGPFSNLQGRVTKGHYGTELSKYLLIIQILTVLVNYSSIKRPIINFVLLIEAVATDGVRHCYSNYLKNLFLMC